MRNQSSEPHDCQVIQKIESCCHSSTAESTANGVVVEDERVEGAQVELRLLGDARKHTISHVIMFPRMVKHKSNQLRHSVLLSRSIPHLMTPAFPFTLFS
jgi:hypothetical protein